MNRAEGYNHIGLQLRSSLTRSKNMVFWAPTQHNLPGIQGGFTVHATSAGFGGMSRSSPK